MAPYYLHNKFSHHISFINEKKEKSNNDERKFFSIRLQLITYFIEGKQVFGAYNDKNIPFLSVHRIRRNPLPRLDFD
jgi:hypothetical protein